MFDEVIGQVCLGSIKKGFGSASIVHGQSIGVGAWGIWGAERVHFLERNDIMHFGP